MLDFHVDNDDNILMQTFLPYKSFTLSLACLDDKRLGKQRVEALQILNALEPSSINKWKNHPAAKMWWGYEPALRLYKDIAIITWIERGFKNNMEMTTSEQILRDGCRIVFPPWLTEEFCAAHRSNLLRKDPEFYGKYGWTEPHDLPYIWPTKI